MVNVVIALAIATLLIAIARTQFHWSWTTIVAIMFAGGAAGVFAFVRRHRKEKWRLRVLAFEDWIDRVSAIARQHNLVVDEEEMIWFRRFVGGQTPEQAVREERWCKLERYPGIGDELPNTRDSIP